MLIPMPPLWLADAALIAADRFRMPELGFVNVPVQVCETARFGIGLRTALALPMRRAMRAVLAVLAAYVVYVQGASRLVRSPPAAEPHRGRRRHLPGWVRTWQQRERSVGPHVGGAAMQVVVLYESLFGNTREVAEAVAAGVAEAQPQALRAMLALGEPMTIARYRSAQSSRCVASGSVWAAIWSGWSSVAVLVVSGWLRLRLTACALALTAAAT
jgi:hypothetical protein